MPRYRLIAARDGNVVNECAEWPSVAVAEAWASTLLALEFRLDPVNLDNFEKLCSETDGCTLQELADDRVAVASMALLQSLHPLLATGGDQPLLSRDLDSIAVIGRMADLACRLREEGYGDGNEYKMLRR